MPVLPTDPEFRAALRAYMEWAVDDVLSHSYDTAAGELPMPHWSWDGLVPVSSLPGS